MMKEAGGALVHILVAMAQGLHTFRALPMAKTSWIEKEKRKAATVAKYAELRAELKKKRDYIGLSQLPRDASPVRLSRRCMASGRKRAFIGRFKLSRIAFRELASNGFIPGVTKSSW
jgi:small subunit ribosomal protein S14